MNKEELYPVVFEVVDSIFDFQNSTTSQNDYKTNRFIPMVKSMTY